MRRHIVMGIDLGTHHLKVILLETTQPRVLGISSAAVPTHTPAPEAMEQEPQDWWRMCCSLTRDVLEKSGVSREEVEAVGLSGEMHSLLLLDEEKRPVYRTILWADSRARECSELFSSQLSMLWNPPGAAYTAPKITWLRKNHPQIYSKARILLYPKDYLRFRMTGNIVTDYSDASGSLLWDFSRRTWDRELLERLELTQLHLPDVVDSSSSDVGTLTEAGAAEMGLKPGIAITAGMGDVAAAIVGAGATRPGTVFLNLGTAAQIISVQDSDRSELRPGGKRTTYLFELGINGQTFFMGALPAAGLSLEWWRQLIGENVSYNEIERLVSSVHPDATRCLFFPYLQGTGTPYLVDGGVGAFLHLAASAERAELTRAIMEGVAFAIKDSMNSIQNHVGRGKVLVTGGLTKSRTWTQILADVLGHSLELRSIKDASAVGAAALAAKSVGHIQSTDNFVVSLAGAGELVEPLAPNRVMSEKRYTLYRRLAEFISQESLT